MDGSLQELVKRAKNKDKDAFSSLVIIFQKKIFNIAFRMIGDYEEAKDLTQEAFIRAYRSIKKFKGNSAISTWLYRIVVNLCKSRLANLGRHRVESLDEPTNGDEEDLISQIPNPGPLPDELVEREEEERIVQEAISSLNKDHRLIIILRDIQGMEYEEIAMLLKLPEGTVKSRINRARLALKDILKEKFLDLR